MLVAQVELDHLRPVKRSAAESGERDVDGADVVTVRDESADPATMSDTR